jgi:ligand-binding sensor domain-containing protein/two-component sensor histidine kinase
MQLRLSYLLLFIFPSIITPSSNSIENINYRFKRIGIEQGLSQSTVRAIIQGQRGYMWFGTATGLNRYDGYEFIVYTNDKNDTSSISDNLITALFEDQAGVLWIGTSKGILNKFDPSTESFQRFDISSTSDWYSNTEEEFYTYPLTFSRNNNSSITSITQDRYENLWVGTWGKGIVKFDPDSLNRKYYYHFKNKKNSLSSNKIISLLVDSKGILWAGTFGGGLNRIQIDKHKSKDILIDNYKIESNYLFGDKITSIYEDADENIWIGSFAGGVSIIPKSDKQKPPYELNPIQLSANLKSISGSNILNIMSITEDHNSVMWIGTYGDGLFSYSKVTQISKHFITESSDPNSLGENEIQSLCVDNSGILWIGTQLGSGINKLEIGSHKFNTIPVLTEENKSLNDNIIWSIYEDSENYIWIGTHRGGLNRWNRETNEFEYFGIDENLADDHIRSIIEDSYGNLWIGSYSGGLSYYDKSKSSFKNFHVENGNHKSLSSNQIQSLLIDGDSLLWIGTFGGGLNKLNLNDFYSSGNAEFTNYIYHPEDMHSISDNRVYTMYKDSYNLLWVGTHGGGVNQFNPETQIFINYKSSVNQKNTISSDRILSIHEMKDGNLLIGTFGGGLNLYRRGDDVFESINEKFSLSASDIYGILSDRNGYWLSTNNGIYKIDEDLNSFKKYDLSDGLQSLEFSGGAYFKGKDGTCYFGGINGINYFNPDEILLDDFLPPIVISQVRIFDRPIKGERQNLVFGRDENYFSFEFASLDFKKSNKNKYKFILEGLDKKWSYTDANNRKVFYTNLAPGDYSFRVLGTNNDGIWSAKEAKVDITILAPFWMRWWFISLVILFIGGVITFLIRQRIKYLVALDQLKSNIAADLHDNVGAGLTEISILSELASNEINKPLNASKHIEKISDLSRQIVESMSDIVWVVNPTRDSLYDLIVRLKDMYGELLADLGIKLETSNLDELSTIRLPMDYRQNLYLILKESIINSLKHSSCKNVTLTVRVVKNNLSIQLMDDGIGFDLSSRNMGAGLNNIKERGIRIGGEVKIISNNRGTTIEFEGKIK